MNNLILNKRLKIFMDFLRAIIQIILKPFYVFILLLIWLFIIHSCTKFFWNILFHIKNRYLHIFSVWFAVLTFWFISWLKWTLAFAVWRVQSINILRLIIILTLLLKNVKRFYYVALYFSWFLKIFFLHSDYNWLFILT